jgi:hypothetical protein
VDHLPPKGYGAILMMLRTHHGHDKSQPPKSGGDDWKSKAQGWKSQPRSLMHDSRKKMAANANRRRRGRRLIIDSESQYLFHRPHRRALHFSRPSFHRESRAKDQGLGIFRLGIPYLIIAPAFWGL